MKADAVANGAVGGDPDDPEGMQVALLKDIRGLLQKQDRKEVIEVKPLDLGIA